MSEAKQWTDAEVDAACAIAANGHPYRVDQWRAIFRAGLAAAQPQPCREWADPPCPFCGSRNHEQRVGPDPQFPGAESPYRHCNDCGKEWDNEDTFRAREHIAAQLALER